MRMKKLFILMSVIAVSSAINAQVQFTRNGKISFYSKTPVEDIRAENNEVVSFIDPAKGELRFQSLIKSFVFPKAAMQEHFNGKDYMNSDQYPQSNFKGTVNLKGITFNKDGVYKVKVKGDLTLHGVTKTVEIPGTITVAKGVTSAKSVFKINREDYGVVVPSFASSKIAKEIEITVDCVYAPYKG